jgi:hypothetical protein
MFTKRVRGICCSLRNIVIEAQLLPQGPPGPHGLSLLPLQLPDRSGHLKHFFDVPVRNKENSVRVTEDDIFPSYRAVAEWRRGERVRVPFIQSTGASWTRAVAEHGKANFLQFRCVPVNTPDHDPGEAAGLGLDGSEISDATLVHPTSVVYDQCIPLLGRAHRL